MALDVSQKPVRNILEIQEIEFSYRETLVLNKFNLTIASRGEVICVLGASGVGKTTLFHLALGTRRPQAGSIYLSGNVLPVFQNFRAMLLPWFIARRNICWGIDRECSDRLHAVATLLEINDKLQAYPSELSGGQNQRVVLARALVRSPDLLLLDEPFSSVDAGTQRRIMAPLKAFLHKEKISAMWITHNIQEAVQIADRIVVLKAAGAYKELNANGHDWHALAQAVVEELLDDGRVE